LEAPGLTAGLPITINLTGNNAAISPASLKIVQLGQQGFVSVDEH
jgi:hypothetical protein